MRRRTLLVALAGLAVVVAVGAIVLWPRQSLRITCENCDRIREGMSRAESAVHRRATGRLPDRPNVGPDPVCVPQRHPNPPLGSRRRPMTGITSSS
jgi:hypothetical protein